MERRAIHDAYPSTISLQSLFWPCACILIFTSVVINEIHLSRLSNENGNDGEEYQQSPHATSSKGKASQDSTRSSSCLEETLLNLPIGVGIEVIESPNYDKDDYHELKVFAHHADAGNNDKWNHNIRFQYMERLMYAPCSVWEVGAHKEATDSRILMEHYPNCQYHAYEPIPEYFSSLERNWDQNNMHLHNYGLADVDAQLKVSSSDLKGESTYIRGNKAKGSDDDNEITVSIKSFDYAIQDSGKTKPTLLHMNCEGCEWDLLPQAIDNGFISDIPIIQIGFHNYGEEGLGKRVIQYCEIRQRLSETHTLVEGAIPFAWERWVLE